MEHNVDFAVYNCKGNAVSELKHERQSFPDCVSIKKIEELIMASDTQATFFDMTFSNIRKCYMQWRHFSPLFSLGCPNGKCQIISTWNIQQNWYFGVCFTVGNIDQKEPKKGKSNRACNVNKVITKQFSESAMKKCLKLLTEMLGGQNCFSIQNGFRKISFYYHYLIYYSLQKMTLLFKRHLASAKMTYLLFNPIF